MKIKYEFSNGQIDYVEVTEEIGEIILQIEHETYNSDRRETRRHESLSDWNDKIALLVDLTMDVEETVIRSMVVESLRLAISALKQDEQELIWRLYLDDYPMTQVEYANYCNASVASIWKKTERIRKKLYDALKK